MEDLGTSNSTYFCLYRDHFYNEDEVVIRSVFRLLYKVIANQGFHYIYS
jgi:hypothetical protein